MNKISVIIPTYNRSSFLAKAIDSVLQQDYSDFEIIVVVDGSTDDTSAILGAYNDDRIKIAYQINSGQSVARNHGLQLAQGDFICFLDDDDYYLPGKLYEQALFFYQHPEVDIVASGYQKITQNGEIIGEEKPWQATPELKNITKPYSIPFLIPSTMIRRKALDKMDHWFDQDIEPCADVDFSNRLINTGCKFAWIPLILSAYVQHGDSSQHDRAKYTRAKIKLLDKFYSQPDLSKEILDRKREYYCLFFLSGSRECFSTKKTSDAKEFLMQSLKSYPTVGDGKPSKFAEYLSGSAREVEEKSGLNFIQFVLDNLPEEFWYIRKQRRTILSMYYFGKFFDNHRLGKPIDISDCIKGVYYDPSWLRNKGVWSISIKSLVKNGS